MKIKKTLVGALAAAVGAAGFVAATTASAEVLPHDPEHNKAEFWEGYFADKGVVGVECTKKESVGTPYEVPAPPSGTEWYAAIIKAGAKDTANEVVYNVEAGDALRHFTGKGNSHIILCHVPADDDEPGTPDPTPTADPSTPVPTKDPTTPVPTKDPTTPVPTKDPTTPVPTKDPTKPGEPTKPAPTKPAPTKPGKPGKPGMPSTGN